MTEDDITVTEGRKDELHDYALVREHIQSVLGAGEIDWDKMDSEVHN